LGEFNDVTPLGKWVEKVICYQADTDLYQSELSWNKHV